MDTEIRPWINSNIDKFIGLNRFAELDTHIKYNEQEIKQLRQYAEQNPNSWQIRFVRRRKDSKDLENKRPHSHKSHTLIKKTASSTNKLKKGKGESGICFKAAE